MSPWIAVALGAWPVLAVIIGVTVARATRHRDQQTPTADLTAVRADDHLLDRVAGGEPAHSCDDTTTAALKTWRDQVDDGLDQRVTEWRTTLGMGGDQR